MIRVFVIDDHAIVRRGLADLLAETADMRLVGAAARGWEGLDALRAVECDVVVLDLGLPDLDGLEVLRRLRRTRPKLPVVVFSACAENRYGAALLRAGAAGFLSKSCRDEELVTALRRVARGGRYVTEQLALAVLDGGARGRPATLDDLSPREFQIFRLAAAGRTTGEISAELGLAPSTVSTYLRRLKDKLGARTHTELVRLAMGEGLLDAAG